ncbi:MAG: hypothetical protein PUD07_00205 [bacterium]|nr:hypothetical protein [bacterium]
MEDKKDYINKLANECLKIIAIKKIKMSNIAFQMGLNLMDLYKLFVNYNEDLSYYLEILYLLQ